MRLLRPGCAEKLTLPCRYGNNAADLIKIMPVKTLADSASDTYLKDAFSGISYAIDAGADIIITAWSVGHITADEVRILRQARDKGILIVASAGNSPEGRDQFPAADESTMAIAALNPEDIKAERSNYGAYVDLAAPGTDIVSASAASDTSYEPRQGTSQAAAIVGAAAALVKSRSGNHMSAQVVTNWFFRLYSELGFEGCSSHSGSRSSR